MCCNVLYCTVLYCNVISYPVLYCIVLCCTESARVSKAWRAEQRSLSCLLYAVHCIMQCCTVRYIAAQCHPMICNTLEFNTVMACIVLFGSATYHSAVFNTVLICVCGVLDGTVAWCTVLYCTALYNAMPCVQREYCPVL